MTAVSSMTALSSGGDGVGAPAVNPASAGPKYHARHARHMACLRHPSTRISARIRPRHFASDTMRHAVKRGRVNRTSDLSRIASAAAVSAVRRRQPRHARTANSASRRTPLCFKLFLSAARVRVTWRQPRKAVKKAAAMR
jgi:hypothetical protein